MFQNFSWAPTFAILAKNCKIAKESNSSSFIMFFKCSVKIFPFQYAFLENAKILFLALYNGMAFVIGNVIEEKNGFCTLDTVPSSVIFH